MKQLTCEMCGSTDLIKQDGVFVCQTCGCKYSVEEAKKMMIEVTGKVDVTGSTVKIDKDEEIKNLLIIARRSYESSQYKVAAQQYYDVLRLDPTNAEAAFFSVVSDSRDCKIGEMRNSAITIINSLDGCTKLVNQIKNQDDRAILVTEMVNALLSVSKTFELNAARYAGKFHDDVDARVLEIEVRSATTDMRIEFADCLVRNIDYNKKIYKIALEIYSSELSVAKKKEKPKYQKKIDDVNKLISDNEARIEKKKSEEKFNALPKDKQNEIIYYQAKRQYNINDSKEIKEARDMFVKLGDYSDSKEYVKKCEDKLEELPYIIEYNTACLESHRSDISQVESAIKRFKNLKDYKDSEKKIEECNEKLKQLRINEEKREA